MATFWLMIQSCIPCGAPNRIPAHRLGEQGRCGACKAPLPAIAEPIEADAALFDAVVSGSKLPVLVDFWAAWCGPCRMVAPEVARVARELSGKALVLKVNTERHPELAARFGVRSIPNFVVFRGGQPVTQQAGAVDAVTLRSYLEAA